MAIDDPTQPLTLRKPNASVIPGAPGSPEYSGAPSPLPSTVDQFRGSEAGRNIENGLAAIPGMNVAAGLMRGVGVAQTSLRAAQGLGAANVAGQSARALAAPATAAALAPVAAGAAGDAIESPSLRAQAPSMPAVPALPAGYATPDATVFPPTGSAPPALPNSQPGVARDGNSFSGNFAATDAGANTSGGLADTQRQLASLQASNTAAPGAGLSVMGGNFGDRNTDFNQQADLRNAASRGSWSARRGFQGDDLGVRAAQLPMQNRARLAEMSLKNASDQSIATMQDRTQQRGQDMTADVAGLRDQTDRRGQDVTARGQDMTARTAAATARLDQMNKDRTFGLESQKFGVEQAKANYEQRKGAEEAYDKELGAVFRTKDAKGGDVADTAKVASFKAAANTTIAGMIERYKQSDDPKHQKMAADLESKGFAALDKKDKEELQQLFERRERMGASRGGLGGTSGFRTSDNLLDYRQRAGDDGVERTAMGGDRLRTVAGGNVSVNDLRYTEPANSIFPDWAKDKTNDLTRGLRGFN